MGYTGKDGVMWNTSEKLVDTPYFFRRNRDLGTISVYVRAIVTSAIYHPYMHMYMCMHMYGKTLYLSADFHPPHPQRGR